MITVVSRCHTPEGIDQGKVFEYYRQIADYLRWERYFWETEGRDRMPYRRMPTTISGDEGTVVFVPYSNEGISCPSPVLDLIIIEPRVVKYNDNSLAKDITDRFPDLVKQDEQVF